MLELENLLNEKQTILVRKMNFSGEEFFSEKKYGNVVNVNFLENSDQRGRFMKISIIGRYPECASNF